MREKGLIKQVPGSRWNSELQLWTVRVSYAACRQLSAIFGKALEVSDELKAFAATGYQATLEMRALGQQQDADIFSVSGYRRAADMSGLQRVGAAFLASTPAAILADEMGSGKTVQAAAAMDMVAVGQPEFHGLVITPNSVKRGWATHIDE